MQGRAEIARPFVRLLQHLAHAIDVGETEQFPKDARAIGILRREEVGETPLREGDGFDEAVVLETAKTPNLLVHLCLSIEVIERIIEPAQRVQREAAGRERRRTRDAITNCVYLEVESDLHRLSAERDEVLRLCLAERTLVVERVDDCFEDRALPGARLAHDRNEPEPVEIEDLLGAKASKAREHEPQRPHGAVSSSSAKVNVCCARSAWSASLKHSATRFSSAAGFAFSETNAPKRSPSPGSATSPADSIGSI